MADILVFSTMDRYISLVNNISIILNVYLPRSVAHRIHTNNVVRSREVPPAREGEVSNPHLTGAGEGDL